MLRKGLAVLGDAAMMAYVVVRTKISTVAREIKEDVSGMEIIQVVMIIAIGVIAVSAVWVVLGDLIKQLWTQVTNASGNIKSDYSLQGPPSTP